MTGALARLWLGARRPAAGSVAGGEGQRFAAAALLASAESIARALVAQDLTADEPVLCVSANAPLDLAGLLGIWLAGGVAIPVSASAASASLSAIRRASGSRLRVAGAAVERLSRKPPVAREYLRGAALIVFTSGSTGKPKGVVLGHQQLAGKLEVLARLIQLCPADTVILPLRLTFIYGIWVSLLTISSGARSCCCQSSRPRNSQPGCAAAPPSQLSSPRCCEASWRRSHRR
jgi:long-chain acyl-CoA synthetase